MIGEYDRYFRAATGGRQRFHTVHVNKVRPHSRQIAAQPSRKSKIIERLAGQPKPFPEDRGSVWRFNRTVAIFVMRENRYVVVQESKMTRQFVNMVRNAAHARRELTRKKKDAHGSSSRCVLIA